MRLIGRRRRRSVGEEAVSDAVEELKNALELAKRSSPGINAR